jgi:hypothetical protein
MPPITDAKLEILHTLAQHLDPIDRGPFIAAVTRRLAAERCELVGDGAVWRIAVEVQREFLSAPTIDGTRTGKYR